MRERPVALLNSGGQYKAVVRRFTEAIGRHMDRPIYATEPVPGAFNVHFFRHYLDRGKPRQHPDMYIAHGWNQKLTAKHRGAFRAYDLFHYSGVVGKVDRTYLESQGIEPERLITVGHPGMDTVLNGEVEPMPLGEKPRLVIAFSHQSFITIWNGMPNAFKRRLADEFDVIEILHPIYVDRTEHFGLARDWLQGASVCYTDISGTMFEAWALGVPVVFPTFAQVSKDMKFLRGMPLYRVYKECIGYHVLRSVDMMPATRLAAKEGMTERETAFIDDYFPKELRGRSGEVAAGAITKLAREEEKGKGR